jgi:hypothetical protein
MNLKSLSMALIEFTIEIENCNVLAFQLQQYNSAHELKLFDMNSDIQL